MEQTVYADLLFLINFSMDFLCMYLVAWLLSKPFSSLRGMLASSLGGLYSVASLFSPMGALWNTAIDLLFCFFMCVLVFGGKHERFSSMLLISAAYFLASVLLGGIMTALFNILNRADPPLDDFANDSDMPLWLFAAVAAVSSILTKIGGKFFRTRAHITGADVEIQLGNRKTVLRAMCDSGNLLRDSLSGKPIIISDKREAINLLPADCPAISDWTTETVADLPPDVTSRIRMIPIDTANAEGLLFALRPDSIVIRTQKGERAADALIGFANIRCGLYGCNALLPPELIP